MKVRDVLARIGDGPLVEALKERGFFVVSTKDQSAFEFDLAAELESHGYVVAGDGEESKLIEELNSRGYYVTEDDFAFHRGFDLYRSSRKEEFRIWLRELFWNSIGRIV